ncbi:unnamed protein product [Brachionus calyciflorus]|uniref:Uncharacterized protein n=1 Tax=Brachionus calyciflorus TaxID=104777 RepID=A0A813Z819_9BILA|nr:unnamed protein product [Brachionus calyciflorus]
MSSIESLNESTESTINSPKTTTPTKTLETNFESILTKIQKHEKKLEKIEQKIKEKKNNLEGFKDFSIDEMNEFSFKNELINIGDISKLDDLLSLPNIDINMTWYSENILMYAIRNRNENIAEFLIQKGIDFNYETKLMEFDEKRHKITYKGYSCRQMAYDYELFKIVDLIDILNLKSSNCQDDKRIRNYLLKRYGKNKLEWKENSMLNKRLELFDFKESTVGQNEEVLSQISNENNFYKDLESLKPKSDASNSIIFSLKTESLLSLRTNSQQIQQNNKKIEHVSIKKPQKKEHININYVKIPSKKVTFDPKPNYFIKKSNNSILKLDKCVTGGDKKTLCKQLAKFNNFYYIKNLEKLSPYRFQN